MQWMEISSTKDPYARGNLCSALFGDENVEHQMYEAVKFIMLYQVIEAYECLNNKERLPSFFHLLFLRDTSLDPLSYMINHLNSVGDKRGLDQVTRTDWQSRGTGRAGGSLAFEKQQAAILGCFPHEINGGLLSKSRLGPCAIKPNKNQNILPRGVAFHSSKSAFVCLLFSFCLS